MQTWTAVSELRPHSRPQNTVRIGIQLLAKAMIRLWQTLRGAISNANSSQISTPSRNHSPPRR